LNTTKVFKKNLQLINEGKKIIVNSGGQHSSKTYSIIQLIIFLAQIVENKIFTIAAESIPFLKVGAMRQFLEIMQENNLFDENCWNMTERIYRMSSNVIEFKGYDTPSKALGAKRDYLFMNECINMDFDTFQNLEGRTNEITFLDFNPSYEFWVHEQLLNESKNRTDVGFVHSTYMDNPYIPKKIIDTIEGYQFNDPDRWKIMGLGMLGNKEGLVFKQFTIIDDFYTITGTTSFGLDFGYTNDQTALVGGIKMGNKLYIDELIYQVGLTNSDISNLMEQNDLRKHYHEIFADSSEPKSIQELKNRGWRIKGCYKGKDSVVKGIDTLQQYQLIVSSRSVNLIKELRQYQWLKDKNGKPTNKPSGIDHAIDALRYLVTMKYNIGKVGTFKVITIG